MLEIENALRYINEVVSGPRWEWQKADMLITAKSLAEKAI